MEMTVRPMTAPEIRYCYAQSQQLTMQTGSMTATAIIWMMSARI